MYLNYSASVIQVPIFHWSSTFNVFKSMYPSWINLRPTNWSSTFNVFKFIYANCNFCKRVIEVQHLMYLNRFGVAITGIFVYWSSTFNVFKCCHKFCLCRKQHWSSTFNVFKFAVWKQVQAVQTIEVQHLMYLNHHFENILLVVKNWSSTFNVFKWLK